MKVEFETHQNLVEEVLDELFFEWPRCQETMKIRSKQLSDKISGTSLSDEMMWKDWTYKSSRGEMKTSLRLIIY
jgi:hypothetical protein